MMRHFSKVFGFTFTQLTGTKGWRSVTILLALLLFLLPAVLPPLITGSSARESAPAAPVCTAEEVIVIDGTPGEADWELLNQLNGTALRFRSADSIDTAAPGARSLLLLVSQAEGSYRLNILLPDSTALSNDDLNGFQAMLSAGFSMIQLQKSGLSLEDAAELAVPISVETATVDAAGEEAMDPLREILGMALPYVTVMLLYFMVLFYGQSVANSAVSEKTSKLMDTFLVSIRPEALMLGKVLACVCAAILQLLIWLLALCGGFAAGAALVRIVAPDSSYLLTLDTLSEVGSIFSPASVAVAVALMLSGFLLYCALAAIGGALASKPEELSSTNLLFTMCLVLSFFACLYGGGMMGESSNTLSLLNWIPFTSILVTPSRILLGLVSPLAGLGSLVIVLICAVLICMLAGALYRMMSFYRGNPPKPQQIISLLRSDQK